MGGFHCVLTDTTEIPLLWRQKFPGSICTQLSSFKNKNCIITKSDLELAASVAQNDILAQAANVIKKLTPNSYDNITADLWQRKGATATVGPVAFLLHLQALHQHFFHYIPLCVCIPGKINVMDDCLSWR